jgi:2-phosphoglycolate phosphatase
MSSIETILFDLDGTLLDTAPDMTYALNLQRQKHHKSHLDLAHVRPIVGNGSRAILKLGFDIDDAHPEYPSYLKEFLDLYQANLLRETRLFPEMETVLAYIESCHLPWGIVTNKPGRFAYDLLRSLNLFDRAAWIVCGDSLPNRKPHPDPILFACEKLNKKPTQCVYIGDNAVDVIASKAAGTQSLIALYGYIAQTENPYLWDADGYIQNPLEIIAWLKQAHLIIK